MSVKYLITFTTLLLMLHSCSQKKQFPEKISERVDSEAIVLNGPFVGASKTGIPDSVRLNDFGKELNELTDCVKLYDEKNKNFELAKMESLWDNLKSQESNFNYTSLKNWIEITGFLLEITGKTIYAGELEGIVYQNYSSFSEAETKEIENQLVPFIFTKNVDHIHVNLFTNATFKYNHSLKGAVEITQETNYPESGKIQIKFKMEKKRFIELFIRIPEWAAGATVTEKGVKYVATHGQYCLVARNWNEGDFVEINLPIEKMPKR